MKRRKGSICVYQRELLFLSIRRIDYVGNFVLRDASYVLVFTCQERGKVPDSKTNIVLFDMDGTLTEARKKADWSMVRPLRELSEHAHIGIVTGSPMTYLEQQCGILWTELGSVNINCISLFPCNGTQYFTYKFEVGSWVANISTNMKDHIGVDNYKTIIRELLSIQTQYSDTYPQLPLTGNFISDRKSMINWCPIGRDAEDLDRKSFSKFDKEHQSREGLKAWFEESLDDMNIKNIECTLGGSTSLDIYPAGWDKTYVLRHLVDYDSIYFVGDKCDGYGNDKSLYEALEPCVTSFKTTGPDQTVKIIRDIIQAIEKKDV